VRSTNNPAERASNLGEQAVVGRKTGDRLAQAVLRRLILEPGLLLERFWQQARSSRQYSLSIRGRPELPREGEVGPHPLEEALG
jgi:hypothetical protein